MDTAHVVAALHTYLAQIGAAPRRRQGRMASGRTLSACRLYSHQHEPPGRARRCFLQRRQSAQEIAEIVGQRMKLAVMSDARQIYA